jgi:hypothetical protein
MKHDEEYTHLIDKFLEGHMLIEIKEILLQYSALPPKLEDSYIYEMWEKLKAIPSKQELASHCKDVLIEGLKGETL